MVVDGFDEVHCPDGNSVAPGATFLSGGIDEREERRATTSQRVITPASREEIDLPNHQDHGSSVSGAFRFQNADVSVAKKVPNKEAWKTGNLDTATLLPPSLSLQLKLSGHRSLRVRLRRWMTEHTDAVARRRIGSSSHVVAVDR